MCACMVDSVICTSLLIMSHDHFHLGAVPPCSLTMDSEAEIIRKFLPKLVTAISDCVHSVSDRCLAEGLIPDSTHRKVLESGGTSKDKARNLLLAVINSTETDSRCFGILLNILEQVLPHGVKDKLILSMKGELSTCMSIIAVGKDSQMIHDQTRVSTNGEIVKQQTFLFEKLENAIRQQKHAYAEKKVLEENIKSKEEENKKLKNELDSLKQSQATDAATNLNIIIANIESQISAFESEMSKLREELRNWNQLLKNKVCKLSVEEMQ